MVTLVNEFRDSIEEMKETPQRKDYHPEVWVWDHEAYVYYNIWKNCEKFSESQKDELLLVSLFHDIGKIDKTFYRDKKECYVSYGHERASLPYYDSLKDAVVPDDLRKGVIRFLIKEHMKPKFMGNMNKSTIDNLRKEANSLGEDVWNMLNTFSKYDDMNDFFKSTNEEERVEAKYRFNAYCNNILDRVSSYYEEDISTNGELFLIRGVPGSGKTTVATLIEDLDENVFKVAADDFFIGDDGKYRFDGSKLSEAHEFCRNETRKGIKNGYEIILVHNTFVERWEMFQYYKIVAEFNYRLHTLVTENRHESDSEHNISESKIEENRDNFHTKL